MPAAVDRLRELDHAEIRRHAEQRFSPERMVRSYLAAYALATRDVEATLAISMRRR